MKATIQRLLSQKSNLPKSELGILSPGGLIYMLRAKKIFKANGIEHWRAPLPEEFRHCSCIFGLEFKLEDFEKIEKLLEEHRIMKTTLHRYSEIPGYVEE